MSVSTQPPPSAFDPRGSGDIAGLHAREVARLVAYLASSDRHCGAREAEDVAAEAFLEVAATWRGAGSASSVEIYLFACAHRIAVARSHLGRSGHGDALAESMPAFGEQSDLARLAVLQDALDQLPAAPRYAVLLREMCGFTPAQSAEIIGLPEASVELARDDALRTLVPVVESGTYAVHARRGPLSPDDFAALSRVLQHPDADRLAERRRVADRLAGGGRPAPAGLQFAQPSAPSAASGGWASSGGWAGSGASAQPASQAPPPSWSLEPGWSLTTPLDAPLSQLDLSGTSTPIFDAISAWFATDDRDGESWEALEDSGWRAATARAASAPEVEGLSEAGLPKRRPGANSLPSAADVSRSMFGEPARVDPGQVRHRLDSFQQGVNTARRLRGRASEAPVDAAQERPWDPLFDPMPARRSADGARPDGSGPRVEGPPPSAAPAPAANGRDDTAFRAFHRDQLPHVLAALLLQGARPADAAEVAQDAFDEAYWSWATLHSPQDWTRDRALTLFAERHDNRR